LGNNSIKHSDPWKKQGGVVARCLQPTDRAADNYPKTAGWPAIHVA
jgi:hypothetical protein